MLFQQLSALNSTWRSDYRVENVVKMNEGTIRLCSRKKHKINIDISLSSLDLYDCKAYLLKPPYSLEIALIYDEEGHYCEQLDTVLKTIMKRADEAKPSDFKPVEVFL